MDVITRWHHQSWLSSSLLASVHHGSYSQSGSKPRPETGCFMHYYHYKFRAAPHATVQGLGPCLQG